MVIGYVPLFSNVDTTTANHAGAIVVSPKWK